MPVSNFNKSFQGFFLLIALIFIIFLFSPTAAIAGQSPGNISVKVEGYVSKPGVYILKKNSRLSNILFDIWPPKNGAYIKDAVLSSQSRKIEQKVILKGLLRDILRLLNKRDFLQRHLRNRLHYRAIESRINKQFKNLKPKGRISGVHLENPILLLNTKYDIRLKNGDKLFIPSKPKFVYVEGAVRKQSRFKYRRGESSGYYLGLANGIYNGTTADSISGYFYLLKVTGKVKKIYTHFILWNKAKNRWEFSLFEKSVKINAGDTIFIPYNYGGITDKLTQLIIAVYKRTGRILDYSPNKK